MRFVRLFILFVWGFCCFTLSAQGLITGKVTDRETGQPLEGVAVLLFATNQKTASAYALTDPKGDYVLTLQPQQGDLLRVDVSMLGYAKQSIPVKNENRTLNIALIPQITDLKEVVVRAHKLWMEHDTLNYSVNLFKTAQDRVIGDVLKKMPGIDVAQNGTISYNGKPINKFYIEGSDLLGGKYGLASKNIPADAVSKVQVLENHQAIRALEKTDFSDQAAINLVLKDGAKSRWLGKIDAGFGAAPFLWDGRAMGMRVGRGMQSMNVYKTNNTGDNVSDELMTHTLSTLNFSHENTTEQADWLSVVMPPTPPVTENRYLFNQSHLLSTNNLWKLSNDYQLRANINYIDDQRNFDTEAHTVYYLNSDSLLTVSERQESRGKQDLLEAGFTLTANTPDYYLQNNLKLRGQWNETNASTWNGSNTIAQSLNTPNHTFSNDFQWIKNRKNNTFQMTSFNSYSLLPQELLVRGADLDNVYDLLNLPAQSDDSVICQNLHVKSFYSNNYFTFKTKKKNWRTELKAGFQAQWQQTDSELSITGNKNTFSLAGGTFNFSKYRYSLQPLLGYQSSRLKVSLALPVNYTLIQEETYWLFNPSLFAGYDLTAYWNVMARAGYHNNFGGIRTTVPDYILTDYRNIMHNSGHVLETAQQNYTAGITYRNPVTAFFASFTATYAKGVSNLLYDRIFYGILSERTQVIRDNNQEAWQLAARASKTIDAWNTTMWLDAGYNYSKAAQLSQHQWTRFANQSVSIRPKVLVKPARWTNVEYEASVTRSQLDILKSEASKGSPLFSMSHFLAWNLNFTPEFQAYIRGEYFYNHASGITYPAVFFADAGIRYLRKQFEFSVDCRNIFNNKRYEYSILGTLSESFSAYKLRPVSVMAKVSWAF